MGCHASTPDDAIRCHDLAPAWDVPGPEDFFRAFAFGKKLGAGSFAQVRMATRKCDGNTMAVKILDLRDDKGLCDQSYLQECISEASVWRAASGHRNIVALQEVFADEAVCFFVMEHCDFTLQTFLQRRAAEDSLVEAALVDCFQQALSACEHIHSLRIVHRDVKPDNFVVAGDVLKLADFGLAAVLPADGRGLVGVAGTTAFLAPEMLKGQPYRANVDVWSLGVVAFVLLYGKYPYQPHMNTNSEMKKTIRDGFPVPVYSPVGAKSAAVSNAAEAFVRALLTRDPAQRPSAADASRVPWFEPLPMEDGDAAQASLAPALAAALRCGAFEQRLFQRGGALDELLRGLHERHEVTALPQLSESDVRRAEFLASRPQLKESPSAASTMTSLPSLGNACEPFAAKELPSAVSTTASPRSNFTGAAPRTTSGVSTTPSEALSQTLSASSEDRRMVML